MKTDIYVTHYKGRILTCLYEDSRLCEIWLEPEDDHVRPGDIYTGKVKNILKNLNAAFVEIRPGVMGYYSLRENSVHHFSSFKKSASPVQGDEILVQVSGENIKSKEWPLTSDICIQGSLCVYFPFRSESRVSMKIRDEGERERLMSVLAERSQSDGAWTIRTAAESMPKDTILQEMDELAEKGRSVAAAYTSRTCYSRLLKGDNIWESTLRRYKGDTSCVVTSDDRQICEEALQMLRTTAYPSPRVKYYSDDSYPIVKLKGIEAQIEKCSVKRVWLPSGGYLVIEQTEAMSVIDVNTGKNISRKGSEGLFLQTNREAVFEAMRQIRVRNLSGMIVIDLINMRSKQARRDIISYASSIAARDPVQTNVVDMTALQLLEITRKKSRRPLSDMLHKL